MRDFVTFMRSHELTMPQVSALFRLRYGGMCGVSDIADHLDVTSAAASQMVDRLVQQGLLARSTDPDDRRVKRLELTPRGHRLLDDAVEARVQWVTAMTAVLSFEQQQAIVDALDLLTNAATSLEASTSDHAMLPVSTPVLT
jgi:DNA-binding MarR family transcriptional regulator